MNCFVSMVETLENFFGTPTSSLPAHIRDLVAEHYFPYNCGMRLMPKHAKISRLNGISITIRRSWNSAKA